MFDPTTFANLLNRRTFLRSTGVGLGSIALHTLLASESLSATTVDGNSADAIYRGLPGLPHHKPTAKRVIFLCMAGGPSHLETFDYKPKLEALDGKEMPDEYTLGQPIAQLQGKKLICQGPMTKFNQYGESGLTVSDYFPWLAKLADDICVIKSMVTEQINHDPAHTFMNTGTALSGRPSMGAWITYGLGSESSDLPGFVVLTSMAGNGAQPIASRQWSAGFLPSRFQGVEFNSSGDPVHYVRKPDGVSPQLQRQTVDAIKRFDMNRNKYVHNPEINTRIAAYEMAYRMQASVPHLMDISDESQETLELYGAKPGDGSFASNCLLARRLAERGVRFIHLYHRGWDHHNHLRNLMKTASETSDRPTWALLNDLKQRGMLEDTLLIWGGEFGRTPMAQLDTSKPTVPEANGRDHHIKGFTMWMAGGGVKSGMTYGATDDLGYNAAENVVHVRDLHATMLHVLGIDHKRLSVRHQGLDMKLTGVEEARVVHEILV